MAGNYDFVINCTEGVCDQQQYDYNGYLDRLKAKEATKKELAEMADTRCVEC